MARQKWSAEERLVAEQAVALLRRQVMREMETAPAGQGLVVAEAAGLDGGRVFLRQMLEEALSAHAEAQKGGSARGSARAVKTPRSRRTPRRR